MDNCGSNWPSGLAQQNPFDTFDTFDTKKIDNIRDSEVLSLLRDFWELCTVPKSI